MGTSCLHIGIVVLREVHWCLPSFFSSWLHRPFLHCNSRLVEKSCKLSSSFIFLVQTTRVGGLFNYQILPSRHGGQPKNMTRTCIAWGPWEPSLTKSSKGNETYLVLSSLFNSPQLLEGALISHSGYLHSPTLCLFVYMYFYVDYKRVASIKLFYITFFLYLSPSVFYPASFLNSPFPGLHFSTFISPMLWYPFSLKISLPQQLLSRLLNSTLKTENQRFECRDTYSMCFSVPGSPHLV